MQILGKDIIKNEIIPYLSVGHQQFRNKVSKKKKKKEDITMPVR